MGLYDRIAALPIQFDRVELTGLDRAFESGFRRCTTTVSLVGGGQRGIGEDVNYVAEEQHSLLSTGLDLPPAAGVPLEQWERTLDEADLFSSEPRHAASRDYRRWAVSSAALDLALRQQGRTLHAALGLEPRPVRFVKSMGLGGGSIEPVLRMRAAVPGLCFKLDADRAWSETTVRSLAETDAVRIVDLKGAYHGTPVDLAADPALYRRIAEGLDDVWIEDPAWNDLTAEVLEPHRSRITWDAPIHSVADIERLPFEPTCLNIKPSRFGSLRRLFEAYDWCLEHGIGMYGGGQFELGPGRGQAQYLASLFHPDAPNDVAPVVYHAPAPDLDLPRSPLPPEPRAEGFAWGLAATEET